MDKYSLIKKIVDKYKIEEGIKKEVENYLREGMTGEEIFKVKLKNSSKVQNAFSRGTLEKDFPSFLLLEIINAVEESEEIDSYKKIIIDTFNLDKDNAEKIIQLIKKETLYNNTLYKVMIES